MRRLGATIAMMLLTTACNVGQPDEDASGDEIYAQLCARCHNADLSGGVGPDLGPASNAAGEDDQYLEFTIRNGRGRMPSFESLNEGQIERLIDHIREVQARE